MNNDVLTSSEVSVILKFIDTTLVSVTGDLYLRERVFKDGQGNRSEIMMTFIRVNQTELNREY